MMHLSPRRTPPRRAHSSVVFSTEDAGTHRPVGPCVWPAGHGMMHLSPRRTPPRRAHSSVVFSTEDAGTHRPVGPCVWPAGHGMMHLSPRRTPPWRAHLSVVFSTEDAGTHRPSRACVWPDGQPRFGGAASATDTPPAEPTRSCSTSDPTIRKTETIMLGCSRMGTTPQVHWSSIMAWALARTNEVIE